MIVNSYHIGHNMGLRPLGKSFLFEFLNESRDGKFIEKSKFGFILTNQGMDTQMKYARWGRVLAIGEKVEDVEVGDLALIEQGKWTTGMQYEKKMYWRSSAEFVVAISNDESVAITC